MPSPLHGVLLFKRPIPETSRLLVANAHMNFFPPKSSLHHLTALLGAQYKNSVDLFSFYQKNILLTLPEIIFGYIKLRPL